MDIQPQTSVQQPPAPAPAPAPNEGGRTASGIRRLVPWFALALITGILAWVTVDAWSKTWQEVDSYNATASLIIGRATLASLQPVTSGNDILDPIPPYAFTHRFVCRELLARFRTDEMGGVSEIVRRHNASLAAPAMPGPRGWLVSVNGPCTHQALQDALTDFAADPEVVLVSPHYVGM